MKTTVLFRGVAAAGVAAALLALAAACDTTPRERQQAVRTEVRKLDTIATRAAVKVDTLAARATTKLRTAGQRAARYQAIARDRKRKPLVPAAMETFEDLLLGRYAALEQLTPDNIEPAFVYFLEQVRAQRPQWTQRDWDYATAISRRLNARFRAIRPDIKARDELHIRALQAEFTALETGRDVKDLGDAVKAK